MMYPSYKSIALVTAFLSLAGIAPVSSKSGLQELQPKHPVQTPAPIQLTVTVTNKKGYVTGLNQGNFQISVDKLPARIVDFKNEDSPVSVGILFDVSGSMGRIEKASAKKVDVVQQGLQRFFELGNKSNVHFLVGFNEKPQLLADWTSDVTPSIAKVNGLKPRGQTALYDACYVGIDKLQSGRHPKRALILISDGRDNSSQYRFEDLRKLLRETGVLVYSINFADITDAGSLLGMDGAAVLSEFTAISGGLSYIARNPRDAVEIFEAIANELRSQYTIGIEPLNWSFDKKLHKIKLKVNSPVDSPRDMKTLSARTRDGYYSN